MDTLNKRNISESYIISQFDKESKSFNEKDDKKLNSTAQAHIDSILKANNVNIALDVGSGTGGIMFKLLENNLQFVYGVDLSPEMVNFSKKRLDSKYSQKFDVQNVSYLDYKNENKIDAISLHRVLCCHPDRASMVKKTISLNPKLVVVTIPRSWKLGRVIVGAIGLLRKVKKGFRPFYHSIEKIDQQFLEANYKLKDVSNTFLWITRIYELNLKEN